MDAFWLWNMMPFIDYYMLGEKNKHFDFPSEKKIILFEENFETLLEKLKSAKVIFIHGDHFPEWSHFFIQMTIDKDIQLPIRIFLSFGSDYRFLESHIELFVESYPNSKFWIQNWCGNLPRVEILPIGFDNNAGKIIVDPKTIQKKYTVVISSFTVNSASRKEFVSFLDKYPELSVLCSPFYSDKNEFFTMLAQHYFSICCAGNGYDTYRFWESIHAKCVPIVLKNEFSENLRIHYPNLPMIILESWEELFKILPKLSADYYASFWEKADVACSTNTYWLSRLSALLDNP